MSSIRFYCVICGAAMKTSAEATEDVVQCPNCARRVPVPRLTSLSGRFAGCVPVFPPEVLDLEVKFLCTSCRNRLRADARWEGRNVVCPVCGKRTAVPRWSRVPMWSRAPEAAVAASRSDRSANEIPAVTLSRDEIEFLSEEPPSKSGAAS
jgi:DNA-directed RNA polymerase subunit RPC12/RpoP